MDPVKAKANFARLSHLLIDKGGEALRRVLLAKIWPSTLVAVLNAKKLVLQNLKKNRVINDQQWDLLYPTSGTPDSEKFDITLLTVLIRSIAGLPAPTTGWSRMPLRLDDSASANVLRIRFYRNKIYGHAARTEIDDRTFQILWNEISKVLIKLLVTGQDIDTLKDCPMSPEEEIYISRLKEWEEREKLVLEKIDNVKEEINDVKEEVKDMNEKVVKLQEKVENPLTSRIHRLAKFNFSAKIETSCDKFQDGTRKWFFHMLSKLFSDKECRVMILTAGPGIGKTVLSAKVCELYQKDGNLAAFHFCDYRNSDCSNPSRILQSLARQMCESVEGFRDKLDEALLAEHSREYIQDEFRVLLHDPLHSINRSQPMLIVIDALDESANEVKSQFLDLISEEFFQLPKWIKFLITSRPELQVRKALKHYNPFEILPDNHEHKSDLDVYIQQSFPNLGKDNVASLVKKCQGSFLFAYLTVTEQREIDTEIDSSPEFFPPKGISEFYKKQFKRLRERLENFRSSMKCFLNVVAAASGEPVPIRILLSCMGLANEQFEVREAIIDIMTEILPVYDDHITVYHKSLIDWLRLDGYEEHEFAADVQDGTRRLSLVCKEIFEKIELLNSISHFEISSDSKFALGNGVKFLKETGETKEFGWLVNVRLNFLRLKFCSLGRLFDYSSVLLDYKDQISCELYWKIFQHNAIFHSLNYLYADVGKCLRYLEFLVEGYFDFGQSGVNCKNAAKLTLGDINEMWVEGTHVSVHANSNSKILSHAIFDGQIRYLDLSPDETLLVSVHENRNHEVQLQVFKLPGLTSMFVVRVFRYSDENKRTTFSPDSSYFIYDSVKTCISIAKQREIPFIPHGPDAISCCSFSSCGSKLAVVQKNSMTRNRLIQLWDLEAKDLLFEVQRGVFNIEYVLFSSCNKYVVGFDKFYGTLAVWDSNNMKDIDFEIGLGPDKISIDNFQLISDSIASYEINSFNARYNRFEAKCLVLLSGETIVFVSGCHSRPFLYRNRKCVISWNSSTLLAIREVESGNVVETIDIGRLPSDIPVFVLCKFDEKNLIISLNSRVLLCMPFETFSYDPFLDHAFPEDCSLSPDNIFIACCYRSRHLRVRNIDSGEILQTFHLAQPPASCYWSEFYLWVACFGEVVKFPYHPSKQNVLGNCVVECSLDVLRGFPFSAGVLVVVDNHDVISFYKVFDHQLRRQLSFPLPSSCCSVSVSGDGRAVLCFIELSMIKLFQMQLDGSWKIIFEKDLGDVRFRSSGWFDISGGQNSMSMLTSSGFDSRLFLNSVDLSNGMWKRCEHVAWMNKGRYVQKVIYANSDFLIFYESQYLYFIAISNGETLATLYLSDVSAFSSNDNIFYLASRDAILVIEDECFKYYKVHNIDKNLHLYGLEQSKNKNSSF